MARLTPSGGLVFGTYLGGSASDQLNGIAVDAESVIVVGESSSVDFPGIGGAVAAGSRGVAAKLTPDGSARLWSTRLGGTIAGVALDSMGSVYVTGSTTNIIATPGAFQATFPGTTNVFAAKG